jgi:hypothetical protein
MYHAAETNIIRSYTFQTSTSLMVETLCAHHADIVGVGRASIADPLLPHRLLRSGPITSTTEAPCTLHRKFLAPDPPAPWWTPPETLANASIALAQWTALLHRRATLGASILRTPISSAEGTEGIIDLVVPLLDASQHEGALWSMMELLMGAEVVAQVVWVTKSFLVFALGIGISLTLRRLGN